MSKYEGALLRSGFDNMETLLDISDETMKKVEIPIGFRIKFNKVRAEMQFGERPRFSATVSNQSDKNVNQVNTCIETDQTQGKPEKKHTSTEAMQTSTDDMSSCFGKASLSYPKNTTKYCFKCFRMANTPQESEYAPGKYFCSERCLKFYFLEQTIVCSSISCKAMGIKSSGAFGKGNWYCSENCLIQTFPENEPLSEIAEVNLNSVENFKTHSEDTEPQTVDSKSTIARERSFSSQNTTANSKNKEEQPVLLFQDVDLDLDF